MKNNPLNPNQIVSPSQLRLIIIYIVIFLLGVIHSIINKNETKSEFAKHYNVSRAVLSKWIKHFCNFISEEEWNRKRKLNFWEIYNLKTRLGTDPRLVLNKAQLRDKADEVNYKTLSKKVKEDLALIGISEEAWESLSVFPPAVSERILKVLG